MSVPLPVDEIQAGRRYALRLDAARVAPRAGECGAAWPVHHPTRPAAPHDTARAAREAWAHAARYPAGSRRRREFVSAAAELDRLAARDLDAARRRLQAEVTRG